MQKHTFTRQEIESLLKKNGYKPIHENEVSDIFAVFEKKSVPKVKLPSAVTVFQLSSLKQILPTTLYKQIAH